LQNGIAHKATPHEAKPATSGFCFL